MRSHRKSISLSVYEVELVRLKSRAKVKDYLALLASRRAREKLLGKHPA